MLVPLCGATPRVPLHRKSQQAQVCCPCRTHIAFACSLSSLCREREAVTRGGMWGGEPHNIKSPLGTGIHLPHVTSYQNSQKPYIQTLTAPSLCRRHNEHRPRPPAALTPPVPDWKPADDPDEDGPGPYNNLPPPKSLQVFFLCSFKTHVHFQYALLSGSLVLPQLSVHPACR
jgi:hypothetical protein